MTRRIGAGGLVALAFIFSNAALAQFERSAMLIDTPTALVMPKGSLCVAGTVTGPLDKTAAIDWWEGNFGLRYGLFDRFELDLTAFTFDTWVLGFNYQVKKPASRDDWSLSIGAHDISWHNHVSAIGHGKEWSKTVWSDDDFRDPDNPNRFIKPPENFSAFAVATVPLSQFVKRLPPVLRGTRYSFGVGRGRYVGYDGPNEHLNTDVFSDDYHPVSAFGLFGGLEVSLGSIETISMRDLSLAVEYDSRDYNVALKTEVGPVTAAVVLHKIEGWNNHWDVPSNKKDKFQRLGLGVSYTTEFPRRKPAAAVPVPVREVPPPVPPVPPPAPPAPAPAPTPVAPPVPVLPVLKTVYFDTDKWDIRPDQRATMRDNAAVLEAHPGLKVIIEGHCDERQTNEYNMVLGLRRAESAKRYLVNLGIDPSRLTTVSYGEERPVAFGHDESSWWQNRRVEFRVVSE